MRIGISERIPSAFRKVLCEELTRNGFGVDVWSSEASVSATSEDWWLATLEDNWRKCAAVVWLVVHESKEIPEAMGKACVLPIPAYTSECAKQIAHTLTRIGRCGVALHSNMQDIYLRVGEIAQVLTEQQRSLRAMLRLGLRKSFPKHPALDATVQYVEGDVPQEVHFFDYFGDEHRDVLWVFGMVTQSYTQSAQMLEAVAAMDSMAKNDTVSPETLMEIWQEKIAQLSHYQSENIVWSWLCMDCRKGVLVPYSNRINTGFLVVWKNGNPHIPTVSATPKASPYHATSDEVVCFSTALMHREGTRVIETLAKKYHTQNMVDTAALSHWHETFLLYVHQELKCGGASMFFRFRPRPVMHNIL